MRSFVIVLLALGLLGCHSADQPKKPENLIPKDKMVDIMYDVFILNAAKGANKTKLENNGVFPQDYVFEKYTIDSLQFAQSNEYYGSNIDDYEAIILKVEQRIKDDKDKYQKLLDEEELAKKKKRDSIRSLSDSLRTKKDTKKKPLERVDHKNYPDKSSK